MVKETWEIPDVKKNVWKKKTKRYCGILHVLRVTKIGNPYFYLIPILKLNICNIWRVASSILFYYTGDPACVRWATVAWPTGSDCHAGWKAGHADNRWKPTTSRLTGGWGNCTNWYTNSNSWLFLYWSMLIPLSNFSTKHNTRCQCVMP